MGTVTHTKTDGAHGGHGQNVKPSVLEPLAKRRPGGHRVGAVAGTMVGVAIGVVAIGGGGSAVILATVAEETHGKFVWKCHSCKDSRLYIYVCVLGVAVVRSEDPLLRVTGDGPCLVERTAPTEIESLDESQGWAQQSDGREQVATADISFWLTVEVLDFLISIAFQPTAVVSLDVTLSFFSDVPFLCPCAHGSAMECRIAT